MEIPKTLESAIEEEITNIKISELKEEAKQLSYRYMNKTRTGESFITSELQAITYSIIRMPATYGAVTTALKNCLELIDINIETLLDVGAGTGSATWATSNLINLKNVTCIERESYMQRLGSKLMDSNELLKDVTWITKDILKNPISEKADLVIASYMTNELLDEERINVLNQLINATNGVLLIIEPGTPEGHKIIKNIKKYCVENNLYVIAPCVSQEECKLDNNNWCHSTCRIQRTKIHKILKDGDAPYEDEKFSYIAVSKQKIKNQNSRILRHPIIKSGFVNLELCTKDGIKNVTISKKDGDLYKQAKKKNCGDSLPYNN